MIESLPGSGFLSGWEAAETAAASHMRSLGFIDAQNTAAGPDGGVDVLSSDAVAQVKFYASPVGRPDLQKLRGAAHQYRFALFYSTGGYTKDAIAYAEQAEVALFEMDPFGNCQPVSRLATLLSEESEVESRRLRVQELAAIQYGYAAAALLSDAELFRAFRDSVTLTATESAIYEHVLLELEVKVREFTEAASTLRFAEADTGFFGAQNRIVMLMWMGAASLAEVDINLEGAVARGWQQDTSPGLSGLLQRIAPGIRQLNDFLVASLGPWDENLEHATKSYSLVDDVILRFAGMIEVASADESILPQSLTSRIVRGLSAGLAQSERNVVRAFEQLQKLHQDLKVKYPRELIARELRILRMYRDLNLQLSLALSS